VAKPFPKWISLYKEHVMRVADVNAYIGIAKNLRHILREDGPGGNLPDGYRKRLLESYAKLKFKELFAKPQSTGAIERESIFGRTLHFSDYTFFVTMFEEIFIDRIYWFESATDSPVILDCGSNIGLSVLFFKCFYPNARILAFEADPETYNLLQRNVESNGFKEVSPINSLLHDSNGVVEFYKFSNRPGSPLNTAVTNQLRGQDAVVTLPAVRLSDYIKGEIDLLKLDIEGCEGLVLNELAQSGKLSYVKEIVLEHGSHVTSAAEPLSKVLSTLEEYGFDYRIKVGSSWYWNAPLSPQTVIIHAKRRNVGGPSACRNDAVPQLATT
jgi:FkbM family methyltransferase